VRESEMKAWNMLAGAERGSRMAKCCREIRKGEKEG